MMNGEVESLKVHGGVTGSRGPCARARPNKADLRLPPLLRYLLGSGFAVRLRVTGRSMAPCLADDDLVTLAPVDPARIRIGDLVYTEPPGRPPLLHRVVARVRDADGQQLIHTKGDALLGPDPSLPGACVLGRVERIERRGRTGRPQDVRTHGRRRRLVGLALALASRHTPRAFSAISRLVSPRPGRAAIHP